ncbi:MFS transporter, partial [Candidatus Bathyarchaeota archaeon]|nr:MFS transporter [Candidatus Bathyarchaeota archaeon]
MNKQKIPNKKSKRNIFALGFVSFFTDLSSEMVLSLLPTFIISLPGATPAILGLIEGVAEALSYGMRAISGLFSDKIGKRKNLVLVGYGLSNIIKPFFGIVN